MNLSMQDVREKATSSAFLWTRILNIPFWAIFSGLTLILYKEFHISPFLVTLLIALKPATALVATYWSAFSRALSHRYLIFTNWLRFLPFLFAPFFSSPWPVIVAYSIYMALSRASVPTWMEMFKSHLSKPNQSSILSLGNALEYLGTTLFPLMIGIILDHNPNAWRHITFLTALIGITSTLFLLKLPQTLSPPVPKKTLSLPWKRSFSILRDYPDFRKYQLGFMLGGAGLMILQPILPHYFVDVLNLSYTEMFLAITVCKGIGFVLTSPFWTSFFKKQNIFLFSALVAFLAALFPFALLAAQWSLILIYAAYLLYGVMQAGSELSWNISGVTFSGDKESQPFSETNILAVGIRGCIVPFLGNFLFLAFNSIPVMLIGALLCFLGSSLLFSHSQRKAIILNK